MVDIRLGSLAIDCPDPRELATFYSTLLGLDMNGEDAFLTPEGRAIWFQQVDAYRAPTWPTQERGQQMHIDVATPDMDAATRFAESIGATKATVQPADDQPDEDFIVMLDPVGHPFCFVRHQGRWDGPVGEPADDRPAIAFRMVFVDCPDHIALATFYADLLRGSSLGEADDEYVTLRTADGALIGFQKADGYQPPTWPTQERGQQMHFDLMVDDMEAAHAYAIGLGSTLVNDEAKTFRVFLDPAGHPFCLCTE